MPKNNTLPQPTPSTRLLKQHRCTRHRRIKDHARQMLFPFAQGLNNLTPEAISAFLDYLSNHSPDESLDEP